MADSLYNPEYEHDSCGIGVIANIKGVASREIVKDSLKLLERLDHRGARGADEKTGDGAGIMTALPHEFFKFTLDFELPQPGHYAVAMVFMSHYANERDAQFRAVHIKAEKAGLKALGIREVPVNPGCLGKSAYDSMPSVYQIFLGKPENMPAGKEFERRLFFIRKQIENELAGHENKKIGSFYFCSFSSRTIVYKGMLVPDQLSAFYPDLQSTLFVSPFCLAHSRYSTNTFPSWDRAHPNRMLVHNGEINTIKGNVKWIRSREKNMTSPCFTKEELDALIPVIDPSGSDSAMFDNMVEFLYMNGYSLPHAIMTMIPEPWENNPGMDPDRRAFYEYHSFLMEPWDGPAAMAFTDGEVIAASLDRNGLRPSRYCVTSDGRIILASEAGTMPADEGSIIQKGRLRPGRMLVIDMTKGSIKEDEEVKNEVISAKPYREWIGANTTDLDSIPETREAKRIEPERAQRLLRLFGYTYEDYAKVIKPMAETAAEGIGAMGIDAPLAVLSEKPQLLYNYFKQLFAQVTNPPIDAIREEIVTGSETSLGSDGNVLIPGPDAARRIRVHNPVLTNTEMRRIKNLDMDNFKAATLPMLYPVAEGAKGLAAALVRLFESADAAVSEGSNLLVLSDRTADKKYAPVPALLAVSALNQHMVRKGTRTKANIIVETGEARETHHFAMLIGYGASAVNPYMAFEIIRDMAKRKFIDTDYETARKNYTKASLKGIIKIMSKMGISTIKSYRGAQIFECIGIKKEFIDEHFTGTDSRIGGIGLEQIARDVERRYDEAYTTFSGGPLESGGDYQYREGEEYHMYNPVTIYTLQKAARENSSEAYREFARLIHEEPESKSTIRSLLEFDFNRNPIDIDEVETAEEIFKRFKTGAMSYGSISKEAHECLAMAMNMLGGRSNTGEGGEDPERFKTERGAPSKCSAIKQVASGRFGVNIEYLNNAKEIQIKMAQGAKPGEGGQLPGIKVYPWIGKTRNSIPGVGLISPPPHHDIYSIEDLGQLIYDLKCANPSAEISVKLVSLAGVGTVAAGVAKAKADIILISGYDGGTGAAPRTSLRHSGIPWELGLAETHQTLVLNNLRDRVKLETDGKLMTGRDVVVAAHFGAEEYGFATAPLVIAGCVMMRFCNLDTCPVGIATQNPELRKCFSGKPEHLVNYFRFIAEEMREYMAWLGFRTVDEMIGRTDRLRVKKEVYKHPKYREIDLSALFGKTPIHGGRALGHKPAPLDNLDSAVLIPACRDAVLKGKKARVCVNISNTDRSAGTMLSGFVARKHGLAGIKEDYADICFRGSAGQSFGAFLAKGVKLTVFGEVNDYAGKGLSGGKIIVRQDPGFSGDPSKNIIAGNVALYGAISGEAYFGGVAGERFCVRNSGVLAVAEGAGDHACEYMTGGRVVILGQTGVNFGAGMSGGIAYVYDIDGKFDGRLNKELEKPVTIENEEEAGWLRGVLEKHLEYTGSPRAAKILEDFNGNSGRFRKVIPEDYRRMTEAIKEGVEAGLDTEEAAMKAFHENADRLTVPQHGG